jgi:membrane-bound serine protease (ClpP class)
MVLIGIALVVVGASLLVAEAHVPAGVLGVAGGTSLAVGAALAIAGAGGSGALVLAAIIASLMAASVWVALAARSALGTRRLRAVSGREALRGHVGVVRSWNGDGGQVLVDGALWRARPSVFGEHAEDGKLAIGDAVVVEAVCGLTLTVRRAEEWEEERW